LKKQSGNEQKLINNNILRAALEWDAERYQRIKDELQAENVLIVGRGQGGSVGLAEAPATKTPEPLRLFVSYSHLDEGIKDELIKHLSPLRRRNLITVWHDQKIEAGDKWEQTISKNLQEADIVILLVSIDFINSEYCYGTEMDMALDRAASEQAVIIPVIARSCMWRITRFSHLQALPTDGKAVATWDNRDEALSVVAEGIRTVAERLMSTR